MVTMVTRNCYWFRNFTCGKIKIILVICWRGIDSLPCLTVSKLHPLFFKNFIFYWSIVDQQCQFQVYSKVTQLYIYMYLFFFQIIFTFRMLHNIEESSFSYPAAMRGTWARFLGWEHPLDKEKATHSSILALGHKELDRTE